MKLDISDWWGLLFPCLVMAGTSFIYLANIDEKQSMLFRLATSAHGFVAAVLFISAVLLAPLIAISSPLMVIVVSALYLIPAGLIVVSLLSYPGPKPLHFWQLLNVPAMLWAFIASLIVLTKWAI